MRQLEVWQLEVWQGRDADEKTFRSEPGLQGLGRTRGPGRTTCEFVCSCSGDAIKSKKVWKSSTAESWDGAQGKGGGVA